VRRFEPVHLPEDRRLHGKASQTLLRHMNSCPRSAYLYALNKGDASTPEMQRGSGLHAVIDRGTRAAIDQGEPFIPPEVVKAIVNEVLADPEFAIPVEEHDYLRESAYRWAAEWAVDPTAVVAAETLFVLQLGGYEVRCRIDFAELREKGAVVYVADYKSSRAAPAFEDVSRKRSDGTLMAKNFQLVLYALVLAFGVPVRVEECDLCEGVGDVAGDFGIGSTGVPDIVRCPACDGSGRVEIPEPFPVAGRAQRFDLEFVFPGIEDRDGKMLRRPVTLTRLELEEYRASLEGLLARLAHSEESGDWPAVAGSHCVECPAQSECPIPAELRDHAGTINSVEQAREAAEVLDRRDAINAAVRKEIKAFAKAHETPIRYGADKVLEFGYTESVRIADKDAMWADMDRAVRYGEPFDRGRYVKVVKSTPFRQRTLSADELAEEAIGGSNE
jgi:PD-(D/E)XK nuclease superfamily